MENNFYQKWRKGPKMIENDKTYCEECNVSNKNIFSRKLKSRMSYI